MPEQGDARVKIKSRVNVSGVRAKARRAAAAGPQARRAAIREMLRPVLGVVEQQAPRDTQRYVRAYAIAGVDLGVPLAVPPVRPGRFAEDFLPKLRKQYEYWQMRQNQYIAANRTHQPYYRKIVRRVERARIELERWDPTAIIILGRGKRITRAVDKVYGGRGRFLEVGDKTFAELRNQEPHARIVEARIFRMREILRNAGRAVGLARAKRAHLRELRAAQAA
ncbi:MAG: hypothetical protein AB7O32_00230 [Vicinamibacterales bacterium]